MDLLRIGRSRVALQQSRRAVFGMDTAGRSVVYLLSSILQQPVVLLLLLLMMSVIICDADGRRAGCCAEEWSSGAIE